MENKSARAKVQAFGGFLTAMVIPNIGAFIAWGFITALFIPTGWLPNEHFAKIVGPMITYLLPVMIGSTGGHLVGGKRGAVMGGIGTIGVIVGAEIPMFLGSMIMGPLGGLVIKYVDKALEKRIPAGFEMVINNFSLGIAGMLLCLLGFEVIGPAVLILSSKSVSRRWYMRVICLCCQSSMNRRKCFSLIMRSIRASIIRWECNRLRLTVNPSSLWWPLTQVRAWGCCWRLPCLVKG